MVQQMHPHYNSPPSQSQFDQHQQPPMNHHQLSPQQQQMIPQQNHFPGQHSGMSQQQQSGSPSHQGGQPQKPQQNVMEPGGAMTCIRHGCRNPAIVNSDWEDEYCSNECVITHCR